jgi:endoglucanase
LDDVQRHNQEFNLLGRPEQFSWDDKKAGFQVLMAKLTGDTMYRNAVEAYTTWVSTQAPKTPKGMVYLDQWGSLRHAANVAFISLLAADLGINAQANRDFAKQQIDYALGDSGRSFVVGFGVNPPVKPHHRSSSCPNRPAVCDYNSGFNNPGPNPQTLFGALVGGPGINDDYEDRRDDYQKNEVATDYNAGFQGALAGLQQLKVRGQL